MASYLQMAVLFSSKAKAILTLWLVDSGHSPHSTAHINPCERNGSLTEGGRQGIDYLVSRGVKRGRLASRSTIYTGDAARKKKQAWKGFLQVQPANLKINRQIHQYPTGRRRGKMFIVKSHPGQFLSNAPECFSNQAAMQVGRESGRTLR